MSDSIDRAQAMTELQMSAKRLTLAYEAHGEGRVEYSDIIIRLSDALDTLRGLPSAQPEQKIGKFVRWMEKRETPGYISFTPHCKCSSCGNELLIENINYCYMCGASLIEERGIERWEE